MRAWTFVLLLLSFISVQGCATSSAYKKASASEVRQIVYLNEFISGFTDNDFIVLCIYGNDIDLKLGKEFTIKIPISEYRSKSKEYEQYFKRTKRGTTEKLTLNSSHLSNGCNIDSNNTNIISVSRPTTSQGWDKLKLDHKDKTLYINPPSHHLKELKKGGYNRNKIRGLKPMIYLPLDNIGIYINLDSKNKEIYTGDPGYYVALPFTLVFDIVTFPIQAFILTGLQHN